MRVTPERKRKLICSNVARILREEREKCGLSMAKVAERAGVSYQAISYIERELRIPGLDVLLRVTDAIGLDVVDLLRRAGNAKVN